MSRRAPLWVDALLRLHPAEYRSRYGDAVREVLAARAASLRGVSARMRFAAREGAGLAASAVREWLRVVSAVRMAFDYEAVRRLRRSFFFRG